MSIITKKIRGFFWLVSILIAITMILPGIISAQLGSNNNTSSDFELMNEPIQLHKQTESIEQYYDSSQNILNRPDDNIFYSGTEFNTIDINPFIFSDSIDQKAGYKNDKINIDLELDPADIITYSVNGWDIIEIDGYDYPAIPGMPALPVRAVNVLIPGDAKDVTIEVTEHQVVVLPGEYLIHGVPTPVPVSSGPDIAQNSFLLRPPLISNDYTLEYIDEGYIRGYRIVNYLFYPLHVTPENNLEVTTLFTFSLSFSTTNLLSTVISEESFFKNLIENSVENPQDLNNFAPLSTPQPTGKLTTKDVKYVIITNTSKVGNGFNELRDWKTKKGVPAEIVELTWITSNYNGNDTQEEIRNFLKDALVTWNIEYCLLGGDVSVIPYRSCWANVGGPNGYIEPDIATDLYYSDLDGNFDADADKTFGEPNDNVDAHPDIIVGRAPVESSAELAVFINKTFTYAKNPLSGYILNVTYAGEYLDASTNASIGFDNFRTNILPSRYVSTRLFDAGYQKYANLSKVDFKNVLNKGSGLIFHSGHSNWNVMSMGSPLGGAYAWYNPDASGLTNGYKIGVLYSIGCITTRFNMNDSIAENHVKNPDGGTVAYIGNSRYGWYFPGSPGNGPSDRYMKRMAEEIFKYNNVRVGENFAAGKDAFVNWAFGNGSYRWLMFALNLIGEPEMYTWTDNPKQLQITHPDKVYYGPQTLRIQVNDSVTKAPIDKALVCLQGNNIYEYGLTDSTGNIDLLITQSTNSDINITVTQHNYIPYEGEINKTFTDTNPPEMSITTSEFGWYNADPGAVIDITFDSGDETDLSKAEYSLSPLGPWYRIFDGPVPEFTDLWSISNVWGALSEGYNKICVRANDSASPNHWVMNNFTVKKDISAPSVTVNTVNYGWYTADPNEVFDVDFSNDSTGSALDRAEYSINSASGPWYNIFTSPLAGPIGDYSTNWAIKWSKLEDGSNSIYIRLYDQASNEDTTSDIINIKRDTLVPIIVVRDDTYGWYSGDPGAVIDIDFSNGGNGSLLDYAQYMIGSSGIWNDIFNTDRQDYASNWPIIWSEVPEGINKIHVRCFDFVGFNTSINDCFTFYKDTTAPKITINKNIYGWHTVNPGSIIDIDFNNNLPSSSLLDYAQYRVHPQAGQGPTGPWRTIFDTDTTQFTANWQINWADLKEGNNTIEIQVFDLATNKNITIDTVYFLKDTTAPEVKVNTALYGWYNSDPGAVIDVDFSNTDIGSDLTFAEYSVNGGSWQKISNINAGSYSIDWSIDWSKLAEDNNTVEVRTFDGAGLQNTKTIHVLKDTIDPEIEIIKEEYGWYNSDPGSVIDVDFYCESPSLSGSTECSTLDFAEYKIGTTGEWTTIYNSNSQEYTTSWSVDWSELTDGVNEIYLRTCDLAGNLIESPTVIKIKKDTLLPNIKINERNYGWYNSDPGAVIDVDFSCLPNGAGPSEDINDHSSLKYAQYKVGLYGTWQDIFVEDCAEYTSPWEVSWSRLKQGENVIYVRVFDSVGNEYFDQVLNFSVFKDTEEPVIVFNSYTYGWYNSDPSAIIDVDFMASLHTSEYSTNSPLMLAQYKIGTSGQWQNIFNFEYSGVNDIYFFETNWGISWADTEEGENHISVRLMDFAGNLYEPTSQVIFQRDTVPPEPPILISPTDSSKTTDTTPQHRWQKSTDIGSNITVKYHIQINTAGSFSKSLVDIEVTSTTFINAHKLPLGLYNWRVRGIDTAGNIGEWSTTWRFEIVQFNSVEGNQPPVADAGEDVAISIGETVWFDAYASTDPENDPLTYLWYIDSVDTPDAEGMLVFWLFQIEGVYTVSLEVYDNHGGSDTDSIKVTVLDPTQDSDNDSIPDAWEEYYGLDPEDPSDALEDLDNDGYINSLEYSKGSSLGNTVSTPGSVTDYSPPSIVHVRVVKGRVYEPIKLTAIVTDSGSGIKEVNLYYKKKSDNQYNSISMGNTNTYSATIPGSFATLNDLEYYIEAVDNAKISNVAYYADEGLIFTRPSKETDIDIDISEDYSPLEDSSMMDEFIAAFNFGSFEVCLIVFVIIIILIVAFVFSVYRAASARRTARMYKLTRTIRTQSGKNLRWEGFDTENIDEEEDLNLIDDDFELNEV
jgi:hypothetical protein